MKGMFYINFYWLMCASYSDEWQGSLLLKLSLTQATRDLMAEYVKWWANEWWRESKTKRIDFRTS